MPFLDEVRRQPRQQEIIEVVPAEMPRERRPDCAVPKDLAEARRRHGHLAAGAVGAWHPAVPKWEPQQSAEAEREEEWAPAEMGDEMTADVGAYGRPDLRAHV